MDLELVFGSAENPGKHSTGFVRRFQPGRGTCGITKTMSMSDNDKLKKRLEASFWRVRMV